MPTNSAMDITTPDPNRRPPEPKPKQGVFTLENFSSTAKLAETVGSTTTINEKDELYNPFDERNPDHPNSDAGAFIHLLKSSLGTGILMMPYAFSKGGLIFGFVGTILTGILCTHCVHILVKSSHELCKRAKRPSLDYAETAEVAFEYGPSSLKKFSGFANSFVKFSLVITYYGSNSVYVYFIAKSIDEVVEYNFVDTSYDFGLKTWMFLLLIVLVPICQIRQLKYLVPFSGVANVSMACAIGITFYYLFGELHPIDSLQDNYIGKISDFPMFFCTVIFAMEGIGVIMPLENSMRTPQHFLGCPGVLNGAMSVVMGLYVIMGFFGYLRYPNISGTITSNIPIEDAAGQVARILLAFAIILTYGLQFFVPMEITWIALRDYFSKSSQNIAEVLIRTSLVILTVVVAAVVQNLETLVGLAGAICFSILGIMIPACVETITCWESKTLGYLNWKLIKNIFLFLFALMTMISGSYSSIDNLFNGTEE